MPLATSLCPYCRVGDQFDLRQVQPYDGQRGTGQIRQGLWLSFGKHDQGRAAGLSETRLLVVTDRPDWPVAELARLAAGSYCLNWLEAAA